MAKQGNALCIARTDNQKQIMKPDAYELTQCFDFQPDSESTFEPEPRAGSHASTNRRALVDKRLLEEIYECVAMQGDLDTTQLQLHACNGIVTIEGSVADRAMRARIGNFIRRCSFAKKVINRMQTRDSYPTQEELQANWQSSWQLARDAGGKRIQSRQDVSAA